MKKFLALYSGGKAPSDPKETEASMKKWTEWFSKHEGSVAAIGNYFSESKTITASGVKDGPEGNISDGYSIFQANSLAEVTALLKGCPILPEGGKVHVFDLIAM